MNALAQRQAPHVVLGVQREVALGQLDLDLGCVDVTAVLSTIQETQTQRSEKQTTGDNAFHICLFFSKRSGLWVWVSFIVLKSRRSPASLVRRSANSAS